jgi:hypothetical protein
VILPQAAHAEELTSKDKRDDTFVGCHGVSSNAIAAADLAGGLGSFSASFYSHIELYRRGHCTWLPNALQGSSCRTQCLNKL